MQSRLCKKRNAEKKLAVTVFSFPPDKGNVGTAAYLNVFGSIYKVLESLKREGYNVGELPANGEELIQTVHFPPLAAFLCLIQDGYSTSQAMSLVQWKAWVWPISIDLWSRGVRQVKLAQFEYSVELGGVGQVEFWLVGKMRANVS